MPKTMVPLTEDERFVVIYLRFGSLDSSVTPIRTVIEVSRIIDKPMASVHSFIRRYAARGNTIVDMRKFVNRPGKSKMQLV